MTVCDRGHPPLCGSTLTNISIIDVNDNRPQFTDTSYEATVQEDAIVGQSVLTLAAVDSDIGLNARLEYHLLAEGHFKVNRTSGQLEVARPLDFEDTALYTIDVMVTDCGHYQLSQHTTCLLYTSPSPRDRQKSRMPSSA